MNTRLVIRFDKDEHPWLARILAHADETLSADEGNITSAWIAIRGYDLSDMQFVRSTVSVKDKDLKVFIPRQLVLGILEGEDVGQLGFGAQKPT